MNAEIRLVLQSLCVRLCYAKYGEISLPLCLFSNEHPGKWKMQAHTERFVKTRPEAASSVSYCTALAGIQLLLLLFSQAHLSVWCHQTQRGREPEPIGLTVSYSLPASPHMLLLYKGCLETKRALQIQTVLPPRGEYEQVPMEKVVGEKKIKTSVLANPSAF